MTAAALFELMSRVREKCKDAVPKLMLEHRVDNNEPFVYIDDEFSQERVEDAMVGAMVRHLGNVDIRRAEGGNMFVMHRVRDLTLSKGYLGETVIECLAAACLAAKEKE